MQVRHSFWLKKKKSNQYKRVLSPFKAKPHSFWFLPVGLQQVTTCIIFLNIFTDFSLCKYKQLWIYVFTAVNRLSVTWCEVWWKEKYSVVLDQISGFSWPYLALRTVKFTSVSQFFSLRMGGGGGGELAGLGYFLSPRSIRLWSDNYPRRLGSG